jgi:hypothetical protein
MDLIDNLTNYKVKVNWHAQNNLWWNETCAMVVEVFGLPGNKFTFTPSVDFMIFTFKSTKDADLCKILLSDRL